MNFPGIERADLEPLRAQIIETSRVDPAALAGYVVIVCTSDGDEPGAGVISSSDNLRTILRVIDAVAGQLRQQIARLQ